MSQPPSQTERIYLPEPSALPVIAAAGLAGVVIGIYSWWPYGLAGAIVLVLSLVAWLRRNREDIARMPGRQPTDTAPLPLSGRE